MTLAQLLAEIEHELVSWIAELMKWTIELL
jgi:hypothetical protein